MKPIKTIAALLLGTGVAACALGGGAVEGIETGRDVTRLMLGARPAEQVAQCMARILNVPVARQDATYLLTIRQGAPATDVVYRVRQINDPYSRFLTQVEQTGSPPDNGPSLGECLPAEAIDPA